MNPPRNGWISRAIARILEPMYYWLDLTGPDGRPANSKVLSFIALVVILGGLVWWGFHLAKAKDPGIDWPFVFLCFGVLAYAGGKDLFKSFLKIRASSSNGGRKP